MKPSFIFLVAFLLLAAGIVAQTPCSWSTVGTGLPLGPGAGDVLCLEGFDDGTGLSLYAGGSYITWGGIPANRIGRWKSNIWSSVGTGVAFIVRDLAVFDDGSGRKLYAGGDGLATWDGSSWSPVATGPWGGFGSTHTIYALAVGDDGSGPALYAGGGFQIFGGPPANQIARWDGTTWSTLGSGVTGGNVLAITSFDDGSGPAIFVSGAFSSAGGIVVANIAKWDGSIWSPLGTGIQGGIGVWDLAVFDDGTGPALYAAGGFSVAGGIPVNRIAKWNGSFWSALGSGLTTPGVTSLSKTYLSVFDDGTGAALYAVGNFTFAGGIPVQGIAKWDGSSWSAAGSMPLYVSYCLTVFNDGLGPALYTGGGTIAPVGSVVRWSCGSTISLSATQTGPGAPIYLNNANLTSGNEYYNIFSFDLCPGGAGTGLFGGLCVNSPANFQFVVDQLYAPLGTSPIHFTAPSSYVVAGPFALPPLTVEAITFDFTGGVLGPISQVASITIQ